MATRPRKQTGFTLLEIIIAMSIVALISAVLLASLNVGFKARRSANAGVADVRSARLAMEAVGRDLRGAMAPGGIFLGSFIGSQISQTQSSVTFFNTSDAIRPMTGAGDIQEVTLALIESADLQPAPSTQPSAVAPGFLMPDQGTEQETQLLVRRVRRQLLAPVKQIPEDQVLCRNVRAFSLRYYDGSQWAASWDSTSQRNAIPLAVEVTLEIAPVEAASSSGKSSRTMTRIFRLPCGVDSSSSSTPVP